MIAHECLGHLALAAAATLALHAPPAQAASPAGESVEQILERTLSNERSDDALEALTRLGADAAPFAVRWLTGHPGSPSLDPRQRELLVEALQAWPEEPCIQAVLGALGQDPTLSERMSSVRLLGSFGGGRAVAPMCAIVRELAVGERSHPSIAREIEDALAGLLRRDAMAFGYLRQELQRADNSLVECMVGALGKVPSSDSGWLLERLLGRNAKLDASVLEAYGMQGPFVERCLDGTCSAAVRRYTSDSDAKLRRHAVVALGRLGDTSVAPDLVRGLDDPDRRVRGASLWSLRLMTGLGWSADVERWEQHMQREEDWYKSTFPGLADDFLDADAARARSALHKTAEHVWMRHETVPRMERALDHEAPAVPIAMCEALTRLGGPEAMGVLRKASDHSRREVREAAQRAIELLLARRSESAAP